MTLHKQYKEDIEKSKDCDCCFDYDDYYSCPNDHTTDVKQSYLNSIDCIMAQQEDAYTQLYCENFKVTIEHLKQQRELIANE